MSFFTKILSILNYRNQQSADGRLRTSGQISLGDYKQYLNDAPGQFQTYTDGGTSTYEGEITGGTTLSVSTINDVVIRQSYQWHNYFAGKPTKIELTASSFGQEPDVIKRMGYFSSGTAAPFDSDLDGFCFENDGNDIYCKVYRSGTQVYSLDRTQWMNQSELSSYDPDDFNFYVIDFLYLGGAVVNFWILTSSGLTKVASYQHINVDGSTFIKSPNQPIRYEIRSSGGASTFNQICSDVAVEGQLSEVGVIRNYDTNTTGLTGMSTATRYALLGVRHAAGARNVILDFVFTSIISSSNDDFLVEVVIGGGITGTAPWAAIPFTNAEGFKGASVGGNIAQKVHSGGVPLISYYVKNQGSLTERFETARKLGSFLDGTSEELFLCVTPLTNNGAAYGSIAWKEFI